MGIQITCVHCGDFFEVIPGEVAEFISLNADRDFLKKFPFPPILRKQFRTRRNYIASLLEVYCPYCRSSEFGTIHVRNYKQEKMTDEKYLKATEQEMRHLGGYQFHKIQEMDLAPRGSNNKGSNNDE